jgi:Ni/Co efflux regulator RcnB
MRRIFAIAAIFALALPAGAMAQAQNHGKGAPHGGGKPGGNRPAFVPHGGPGGQHGGPMVRGHVGGPVRVGGPAFGHPAWMFHGHSYAWHPVRFAHPWVYPAGFGYRLWAVGAILPPLFWAANSPYYYAGWADMGLPPPDPGYQYVQYGPDLLLVNVGTGEVVQVFPGAFN